MFSRFTCALCLAFTVGCVTPHISTSDKTPPAITLETETDDAIAAAVEFGGPTLEQVKALVEKRNEQAKVSAQMETLLIKGVNSRPEAEMINAMHLYQGG